MANPLVHQLANLLMQRSSLTVEIVPGGIEHWLGETAAPSMNSPFLLVDGHLGVPTKTLYQLYLVAVGRLNVESKNVTSQIDASCVILLANPAHQTALNVRKRLIQTGALSADAELVFSARLLSSSRTSAKESILWAHRRWTFSILYPRTSQADLGTPSQGWECDSSGEAPEIPPDVTSKEFELISRCCEFYPRNYHAWSHHHFVAQCIFVSLRSSHPLDSPHLPLLVVELQNLRRWIESHISDYSAMHQLNSLVCRWQSFRLTQYNSALGQLVDPFTHFEHALSLVKAFPSHESLWMYLRGAIGVLPHSASTVTLIASTISATAQLDGTLRDQFVLWVKRRGGLIFRSDVPSFV
ncbi:hypothetical protein B0H11DRAFT_1798557 [Mycena galericulata]|nr:hypothetical protein B0H11DRAFT_1798557 [Mycena galericulata]